MKLSGLLKAITHTIRVIVRLLNCLCLEEIRILNSLDYLVTITGQLSEPAYFDNGF